MRYHQSLGDIELQLDGQDITGKKNKPYSMPTNQRELLGIHNSATLALSDWKPNG